MNTKNNTKKSDQEKELDQELERLVAEDVAKIVDPEYNPYPSDPDNPYNPTEEEIKKAGQ